MRRLTTAGALLALATAAAPGGLVPAAHASGVDCQQYCGERAAQRCDRINSWECTWYIAGCLAGCNLRQL